MILAVDASYQYVVKRDHGLVVVKIINHSQQGKTITYAVCNQEDHEALRWIFVAIQVEVEAIVNHLIENGEKYMLHCREPNVKADEYQKNMMPSSGKMRPE